MSTLTLFKRQYYYYYGDVRSPLSGCYEIKLNVDVAVVLLVSIGESAWDFLTLHDRIRWVVVGGIFLLIALFLLFAYVPIDLYELGLINVATYMPDDV